MLIRYHLIYYALGCVFIVLGRYFHYLFFLPFVLYLFYLYRRLTYKHVLLCVFISLIMLIPKNMNYDYSTRIKGSVEKVGNQFCYINVDGYLVKLYGDYDFQFKDIIDCEVEYLQINENTNDHGFNEKTYLQGQNIAIKASLIKVYDCVHHYSLYHYIESKLSSKEKVNSYQRLLLLSERSEEINEDYQQLSDLSLVHLFALSGMHVSILYQILFLVLGLFLYKKYAKWICYVLIGIYVFSIPFQISLLRAFFMIVLSEVFKDKFNKLDILAVLIIASFIYNPYLFYNISFIFSYFIYFMVLITRRIKYSFFYIYLSSLPIILSFNYEISILSFMIASFFNPFIEVFYTLCVISIVFPFSELLLSLCIQALDLITQFLMVIPNTIQLSKPNLSFILIYYLIYFKIIYNKELKKDPTKYLCMLLSLIISFSFYSQNKIYGQITMIDVGQGDCTLIRLPYNQGNLLIDTGGNQEYDLATKTIIPYLKSIGVHRLDYVYISHDDYDHCGALDSLLNSYKVENVIREYEEYRKIGNVEIKMLKHNDYSDSNDQSLIMHVIFNGFSVLFTGDASIEVEKELIDKYPDITADILKVGHHGSSTSTSAELLNWLKPKVALIGVKKNNIYRHPSHQVIDRLNRKNIMILRTDQDGMFHIRFYNDQNYIIYR